MCRLLGVVAASAAPLSDLLPDDLESFASLSARHCDGWGIASLGEHDALAHVRHPHRASESAEFSSAVAETRADTAILHLRRASSGLINTVENTHPFTAGQVAFAHNGYAEPISQLDHLVELHGGDPSVGTTDSERYFHLVLAFMRSMPPELALRRAARTISLAARAESLNALLLTPDALYAIRADDPDITLANGNVPAEYALHYREEPDSVTIASTGWERHPEVWTELANWNVLEIPRHPVGDAPRVVVHSDLG